ncbi:adenosylcobinamide-phosphate synthase CbiB [Terrarubrum flagellatum]|uniref:adenosylcobinamide-phosphate synthase CbiB n=1 Tax=Terrirubrum flagellatum TaxID=2895980 RepID=UPI0031455D14
MSFHDAIPVVLAALVFDALIGDPDGIWRRWPHPVVWIGRLISALDARWNDERTTTAMRRMTGVAALATIVLITGMTAFLIDRLARLAPPPFDTLALGLIASIFIAQKSLYQHVARVSAAFRDGGLPAARRAVSMIVGRNPDALDESGVSRAAIESCAENFSDGVVAPVFWLALFGLPGLVIYKAVNTADSMIGHRSARHLMFGWASARCDDALNWIPARLSGVLVAIGGAISGGRLLEPIRTMFRDARLHRSPNAGWPEAAMAASLGVALGGPRQYPGYRVDDPFLNGEGRAVDSADIDRALRILVGACIAEFGVYAGIFVLLR